MKPELNRLFAKKFSIESKLIFLETARDVEIIAIDKQGERISMKDLRIVPFSIIKKCRRSLQIDLKWVESNIRKFIKKGKI